MAAPLLLSSQPKALFGLTWGRPQLPTPSFFPFNGPIDTFPRADENPLAGGWLGPIEAAQPQLKLVSNAVQDVGASYGQSYWNTSFAADQEVFVDVPTLPASAGVGVWARVQNPGNAATATGYLAIFHPGGNLPGIDLYKLTAGHTYTLIGPSGSLSTWSRGVASGDGIGLRVVGTSIQVWHRRGTIGGWDLAVSTNDATVSGAGFIGIEIDSTAGIADNFGGGAIPVLTSVSETPTPGGATAAGVEPTVQVPVPQSGAIAGGPSPTVSVSVPQGGATAGGFAPTPATSLTISGATAGGFAPTARVTSTISGAIAGGNAPTSAASVDLGGSNTGGFGATVRVTLTIGGATAGGFAPSESSSVTESPTPGGATAGGFGPTVRVAVGTGGATAGGYGPNDGSAPAAGPPGDPNYFLLIHP